MSQKNSDYKLSRANVYDMLPEINQDPLVKALAETTFNRFYTKPELQRVIGTIGSRKSSTSGNQITETNTFDQAYQLQPAIVNNSTSETQISTYKDIERLCAQLGIDMAHVRQWQSTEQFNYALPINIDKMVNYNEYYWNGIEDPEYIVIENPRTRLQARLSQVVSQYQGSTNKDSVWQLIVTLLDLVNANVPQQERLSIPNLDIVLNDPSHSRYIPTVVTPSSEYTVTSDWAIQNKWVHRLDVYDLSTVTQAKMPIIEYNENVQLTSYTYTGQVWKYRRSPGYAWTINTDGPSHAELFDRLQIVAASRDNDTISVGGNHVDTIIQGEHFIIEDSPIYGGKWLAQSVTYDSTTNTTTIKVAGNITVDTAAGYVRPFAVTSLGDDWRGLQNHWLLVETQSPKPSAPPTAIEAFEDQGKAAVPNIRISEDEDAPWVTVDLTKFRHQLQKKTTHNQYPLFDIVDINGVSLRQSANIVAFAEDPSAPVDPVFGKRIVRDALTKDYTFNVSLVEDDSSLRFYVNTDTKNPASIWSTPAPYVPRMVDSDRNPVSDDTPGAVFEIPEQFVNNVHHECRNTLKYSELFLHLKSILDSQAPVDLGIYGGNLNVANSYRLSDSVDYSVGGTIKEYNYSFDNFVSSLISSYYTLPSMLTFAENQYSELLVNVRELVEQNIYAALTSTDPKALNDVVGYIEAQVLQDLHNDTTLARIYGDSSVTVQSSVSNWIATLPYLRLVKTTGVEALIDPKLDLMEIIHHDGHSISNEINLVTSAAVKADLISKFGLYPNKVQQPKPTTDLSPSMLWYEATSKRLFRLEVTAVGPNVPNADNYPEGSYYFNPVTTGLYLLSNGSWNLTIDTVDTRWKEFDVSEVIVDVIIAIETRLAGNAPTQPLWTDKLPPVDTALFNQLLKQEYEEYCKVNSIVSPYTGNVDATNAFTWNYTTMAGDVCWQTVYSKALGTPYPHLEPWKLQGYDNKPTWWDELYADKTGTRRWTPTMWVNIISGVIPNGFLAPVALRIPTKVGVNITSHTTADGYAPDDLLPPYWVAPTSPDGIAGVETQSMFTNPPVLADVVANSFAFGENGPKELAWKKSLNYNYAVLRSMFRIDPIRFLHYTFGEEFVSINGLEVNARTNSVLSHRDVIFHGDSDSSGNTQLFDGINQLYVNFFRYNSLDLNGGEFKRAWTTWTTQLSYNVGSFVIDNTLSIDSNLFEVTPNDYSVEVKQAHHVRDIWVDALYVSISQAGDPRELLYGAARDWKFNIATHCPIARDAQYYGVKKLRVQANDTTNVFTLLGGSLSAQSWTTGSPIVFDIGANGVLPKSLDDMSYYFMIVVNDTTFMIADSKDQAMKGTNLLIGNAGQGAFYVAELDRTFYALEGLHTPYLWKHFALNKNDIRTFSSNVGITGLQNVIDFIDGYSTFLVDQGIVFNDPTVQEYDASTNRQITWQYLTESMIDTVYLTGQVGNALVSQFGEVELNPFRHNIWIQHLTGVVSEFNSLDIKDTSSMAIAYDINGVRIDGRNYHVLREDTMTHIMTVGQVTDGTQIDSTIQDFDQVAFAGFHMYFDEYEHIIMFNPYTISNALVYDSFLGIAASRFNLYFEKQADSTKRPNIGGFVYKDGKFIQNYEYTASNIQNYYDSFTVNENSDFVNYARRLLGYTPNESYMTANNVTPKSQFLFYKGMIKSKGTVGSVKAFANSAHFPSAEVDEFWAYRAFDFGDSRPDISYTMTLVPEDTVRSHAKFEFLPANQDSSEEYFTAVPLDDTTRWPDFPRQADALTGTYGIFGTKVLSHVNVTAQSVVQNGVTKSLVFHEACDAIVLYQNQVKTDKRYTYIANGPSTIIMPADRSYIPGTGSIHVYVNGVQQVAGVDYIEVDNLTIQLTGNVPVNSVVVVIPGLATLVEGNHYVRLSNSVIQVKGTYSDLELVCYSVDYDSVSPVHIYDATAKTMVSDIAAWDPLSNNHQAKLNQYVDLFSDVDPAYDYYNNTPRVSQYGQTKYWNAPEVGTIWLDTNSFNYVNYKDTNLSTNARLVNWGKLEEWSNPAVYRWTESTVAPQDYTDGAPRSEVYSRTRVVYQASVTDGFFTITSTHTLVPGDEIAINADSDLPSALLKNTVYVVGTVAGGKISITDRGGNTIAFSNDGDAAVTISKASFSGTWLLVPQTVQRFNGYSIDLQNLTLATSLPEAVEFSLFANGIFVQDGSVSTNGIINIDPETMDLLDTNLASVQLTVIRKTGVIDGLSIVQPADLDLTPASEQTFLGYPNSRVDHVDASGVVNQSLYYFWARGSSASVRDDTVMTTSTLERLVYQNDDPYMIIQHPVMIESEVRMNQLILSGVNGVVSDNNRYTLRIRQNYTLRQRLMTATGSLLKPTHSEWIMFRENQNQHIDRSLWNMVIESIVGHSVSDSTIPVPSLDRVVYDNINGTYTRYGIGSGQALVDGSIALSSILSELNSSDTDFSPIDIDYFLDTHDTVSEEGLMTFLNDIYSSFPAKHVNKLFFAVLMDALANINVDYSASLMKTSAISINGVTPLNVNGEFDE